MARNGANSAHSVSESADSELAFQMQLDEVLAASLAMETPFGPSTQSSTEGIPKEDLEFVVGETSRGSEKQPQDAEWIEDDPVRLYNYSFGHQLAAGGLNQDRDVVFEGLKEQYRMFELTAISREDGRLARVLSSLPEFEDPEELEAPEEYPGDPSAFPSAEDRTSIVKTAGSCPPRKRSFERVLAGVAEAAGTTCNICLTTEITASSSHVVSETCLHRFCTDCLRKHGETMVKAGKSHIPCPEYGCEESLSTRMCELLLSSDLLLVLNRRQVEDVLAQSERVYCPYNDCSWLQLRPSNTMPTQAPAIARARVQCLSCHRYFCLECQMHGVYAATPGQHKAPDVACSTLVCVTKVPWHDELTCEEYKSLPEDERSPQDIALLKGLVAQNNWQRCACGHIVEKTDGCNHISCRCGKQFCYICGQEWTNHLSNVHSCRRP